MAGCWLILLIISVVGLECSREYIDVTVSGKNVTWKNANKTFGCTLAGLDRNGTFDPTVIRVVNHTGSLDAWIGVHLQSSQWMNITGCYSHDDISIFENYDIDISDVGSPVETCFDHCSSDEFAITGTRCYCLYNATTGGSPCFGHVCGQHNNSLCGNNTCLCQYKRFIPDSDLKIVGDCMTVRKINNRYEFIPKYCTSNHTFVCSNTNQSALHVYGENQSWKWTNALYQCSYNRQLFLGLNKNYFQTFEASSYQIQDNVSYWVGMFKLQYFTFGYSGDENTQCIALHIDSKQKLRELRFRNCSSKLPILCAHNEDVIGTTQTGLRNVTFSYGELYTSSGKYTTPFSPQTSAAAISSVSTTDRVSNRRLSVVPLPPILGSVTGLALIVLITFIVCLIKRRKRKKEHQKRIESSNGENTTNVFAVGSHSLHYVDVGAHQHNSLSSDVMKNTYGSDETEDDYTYNHLHSACGENIRVDHLYHHTTDFRSEYDSLDKFNYGKDGQSESEYDHIKANSRLPSSADTGNYDALEELDKNRDAPIDDTYDHM